MDADLHQRRLERALHALAQAEALIEQKSLQLYQDDTQRRMAERTLRDSEELFRLLVENVQDYAILMLDPGGRVVSWNKGAERIEGYSIAEIQGQHFSCFYLPEDIANGKPEFALESAQRMGRHEDEGWRIRKNGERFWAVVVVTSLLDKDGALRGYGKVMRDISERKHLETQLQFQATHDELTGLPNRNLFMDRMRQAIAHAKRNKRRFVVAFIDLDRFKWINDSLGHKAGDELLKIVSQRMSACLREVDTVARLGGDEFILLLQEARGVDEAARIINRLVDCVSQPILLGAHEVAVTCSVGYSTYPEDGSNADVLLKYADVAMYSAKEAGRNNVQIYNAELRTQIDERVKIETDLRHAIEREEFVLHYQPQIDLRSGAIKGVEALLRWRHPELGLVPPMRFIPIAEESGLIEQIGAWAIRHACVQNKAWQDAGLAPVCMAVNLSARQFSRPGLETRIAQCLSDSGLDPAYLELELTESASMDDPEHTIPLLHKLKELGVGISIDDFGTGYSNMQYLTSLPIDSLKLDGSFVQQVTNDPGRLAIVEAVIVMAHRLGLQVIGEMAETEGQVMRLAASGCDYVQGFYFSEAVSADDCALILGRSGMNLPNIASGRHGTGTLLILDDEPHVISALERALRHERYQLLLANHVDEAFELLARHSVDVVLSDLTLQESNGIEFLSKVKRMYPDAVRLILTGSRNFESASDAINRGAVHRFLTKPWDNQELREILAEAFKHHAGLRRD